MKKLLIAALCCLTLCKKPTSGEQTQNAAPASVQYVSSNAGLILREKPDKKSKSLGVIPFGAQVQIVSKTGKNERINAVLGEWVELSHDGKKGFAFNGFLSDLDPKSQPGGYGGYGYGH